MVGLVIRRIIEYKTLFRLYPLIATDAEIERETEQHDKILQLMADNMNTIRTINTRKAI